MNVRQVPGCCQVTLHLQQWAEIKRFSWRLVPIVPHSVMCLWQCATQHTDHLTATQLTPLIVTNAHMYSKEITKEYSAADFLPLFCH